MSILLSCEQLTKQIRDRDLFANLNLSIHEGQRLGVIGPNGAGKSTLMRIIMGTDVADSGKVVRRKFLRITDVPQSEAFAEGTTVLSALEACVTGEPHERDVMVQSWMSRLGFEDPQVLVSSLSGGWKKRLSLARALVRDPELIILDEPTNHLDLDTILWLEEFLDEYYGALVIVSHDRSFLNRLCTRFIEINGIYQNSHIIVEGNYDTYLEERDRKLDHSRRAQEVLANKMRREEEWLSRGPKARTTKQQARIDAAGDLASELSNVNQRLSQRGLSIEIQSSERQTRKLVEFIDVNFSYEKKVICKHLDLVLGPGTKLGILGRNGSGKTTLLKMIAGELKPTSGVLKFAPDLRLHYFSQHREHLEPHRTVRQTLATHGDQVVLDNRTVHVVSWAKKFGFRPDQMDQLVSGLSGGEQARLLMGRFLAASADVLVFDEPTNDLDIQTLESIEEKLGDFHGAIVVVSHDRYFLDQVCRKLLFLKGGGSFETFTGLDQYNTFISNMATPQTAAKQQTQAAAPVDTPKDTSSNKAKKKLSYMEQREFDSMEEQIALAEAALSEITQQMQDPKLVTSSGTLSRLTVEQTAAEQKLQQLYERWQTLDAKRTTEP
jgi:ATP-binding cassette subfamily F protein uup